MSIFRNTVWFLKGMKEYTAGGYASAAKSFKSEDLDVDCSGKSYMITGANSGIGKEAAIEIAKRGGVVHLVCRNPSYGETAKNEMIEISGNNNVHLHILDMSMPKAIINFTKKFSNENEKLDVLVNNAGCMVNTREVTEENLEKNFATNTLGTYLITEGMMELLKKSSDPRVIVVSSGGMLVQKLNVNDLQFEKLSPFDGTMAYAQNKRQQIIMTEKWAQKFPSVHFSAMHPGWADTPAVRSSMPDFYEKMKDRLRTVAQGADTIVWLSISKAAVEQKSGLFFQDRTPVSTHLPLACTRTSSQDEDKLIEALSGFQTQFSS